MLVLIRLELFKIMQRLNYQIAGLQIQVEFGKYFGTVKRNLQI